jgi:hypothetical protein
MEAMAMTRRRTALSIPYNSYTEPIWHRFFPALKEVSRKTENRAGEVLAKSYFETQSGVPIWSSNKQYFYFSSSPV